MQIPSYQISNVIKVYSRQLSQSRMISRQENLGGSQGTPVDKVQISPEGKKQTIISKVSDEVFSRLTKYGSQDQAEENVAENLKNESGEEAIKSSEKNNSFVFNFLDENNEKTTNEISFEGSKFVDDHLEKIVNETINNDDELKKSSKIIGKTDRFGSD